jgi:hypothetical protein
VLHLKGLGKCDRGSEVEVEVVAWDSVASRDLDPAQARASTSKPHTLSYSPPPTPHKSPISPPFPHLLFGADIADRFICNTVRRATSQVPQLHQEQARVSRLRPDIQTATRSPAIAACTQRFACLEQLDHNVRTSCQRRRFCPTVHAVASRKLPIAFDNCSRKCTEQFVRIYLRHRSSVSLYR